MRWKCISSFHLRFHFPRTTQNPKHTTIKCFIQNIFRLHRRDEVGKVVVNGAWSCRQNRNGIRVISATKWSKCRVPFVCWALMMTSLFRAVRRTIRYQLRGRLRIAHSPSTPSWEWLHMIHKGNKRKIRHQHRRRRWKGIARGLAKKIKVVCKTYTNWNAYELVSATEWKKIILWKQGKKESKIGKQREILLRRRRRRRRQSLTSIDLMPQYLPAFVYFLSFSFYFLRFLASYLIPNVVVWFFVARCSFRIDRR